MRIWDINPGYLNRQSLLGEHRELHGIYVILKEHKKGYSNHPETVRWKGYGWALRQRHAIIREEMTLRCYKDQSPVRSYSNETVWPGEYIDLPEDQFKILESKYKDKEPGRIPLPKSTQELWAQHKYSVMARDPATYKAIGKRVSKLRQRKGFSDLSLELTDILRQPVQPNRLRNALEHMWGYVADYSLVKGEILSNLNSIDLLAEICAMTMQYKVPYLISSTAISELGAWVKVTGYL
jgi:hypothetical protein